jgi:hypothetical protein
MSEERNLIKNLGETRDMRENELQFPYISICISSLTLYWSQQSLRGIGEVLLIMSTTILCKPICFLEGNDVRFDSCWQIHEL